LQPCCRSEKGSYQLHYAHMLCTTQQRRQVALTEVASAGPPGLPRKRVSYYEIQTSLLGTSSLTVESVFLIAEFATCVLGSNRPVDCARVTIHTAGPGAGFSLQRLQFGDASFAEALTGEQTDFDFRLIEPASMRGRVVDRQALPDPVSRRLAAVVGQGLR